MLARRVLIWAGTPGQRYLDDRQWKWLESRGQVWVGTWPAIWVQGMWVQGAWVQGKLVWVKGTNDIFRFVDPHFWLAFPTKNKKLLLRSCNKLHYFLRPLLLLPQSAITSHCCHFLPCSFIRFANVHKPFTQRWHDIMPWKGYVRERETETFRSWYRQSLMGLKRYMEEEYLQNFNVLCCINS